MKKIFMLSALMAAALLAGCGSQSSAGDGSSSTVTTLETFSDDIEECTPYLGSSSLNAGGVSSLSEWSSWNPNNSGSVLGKLFNPSNGEDECFYTQIATLDSHISMVNEFSRYWEEGGQHTINSRTAVINNSVGSVSVPYLHLKYPGLVDVAVDREITLQSGTLTLHMAFSVDSSRQVIVEQYTIGSAMSGVYYSERVGDSIRIWHASVRDSRVQFAWDGDTGDKTFRITECTDAGSGTNWQVMGGGSTASDNSEMAFMARNDTNNSSDDEYYISITKYGLMNAITRTPVLADATHPDGQGVLAYIDEDNIQCIDFLSVGEYPDNVSDLAWID